MIKETEILIENTDLTIGWLLEVLRKNDVNFANFHHSELVKYDVENIATGKAFLSQIFRIRMHFARNGECDVQQTQMCHSVVVKVPGSKVIKFVINEVKDQSTVAGHNANEKNTDSFNNRLADYHHAECQFYDEIAPLLDKNFPLAQIEEVVKYIAQFHSWSLRNRSHWEGKFLRHQSAIHVMANLTVKMSPQLCALAPGVFDDSIRKLKPFFENQYFLEYFNEGARRDSGLPKMLLHGDLWSHNILWERCRDKDDQTNSEYDCSENALLRLRAIIDWQIMHEGNAMNDLARLLVFCCDAEVRKKAEENIFDYYRNALIQSLNASENSCAISSLCITDEKLKFAYKYVFLHEVCVLVFVVPMMFGLHGKNETGGTISQLRRNKIIERTKVALQDAVSILERDHPEWLSDDYKNKVGMES
ncbi:ecdysteroid kinase domain-containing protein [Ditylenchus destructor]|nr:ecdysteroid kinase domain-containing protein [Ditylenchus destructor]